MTQKLFPDTPCLVAGFDNNRTFLTTSTEATPAGMGWHSYEKWAYAKRWNGYNNGYSSEEGTHEKKKGWEAIEHWYQTIDMGEGYFDFVKTTIDPVLILLDQHGFEIMRKPLPSSPDDPKKEEKYAAIRPYNSPMVKEYAFWATAKKRSGLHQYYQLNDRVGGDDFTSTDLTNLPPYGSENVLDKKGNQNDQYVTYIVKDEYAQTYDPKTKTGKEFLIEQGTKYASTTDGTSITKDVPASGMKRYIIEKSTSGSPITDAEKWYVKPNATIDTEMGYGEIPHTWTEKDATTGKWKNKEPNAYEHYKFKNARVASYISDKVLTDSLGYFAFSNGFDPYNIQIESVGSSKYMKTNADDARLSEGSIIGTYPTNPGTVTMGDNTTPIIPNPKWYDERNLPVTNATFMAVQDADGNMQLMPRFDHSTRMGEFGELIAPTDAEVAKTYTKLYRPVVYDYRIIDNSGSEALRYRGGGDLLPQTPDQFKSPLATDFKYYAGIDGSTGLNEITGALDGATLTENKVYVRYIYDEEADQFGILKGQWFTMKLNSDKDRFMQYTRSGIYYAYDEDSRSCTINETDVDTQAKKLTEIGYYYFKQKDAENYWLVHVTTAYDGTTDATYTKTSGSYATQWSNSKPLVVDTDAKKWQWKFVETSLTDLDPYNINLYNRDKSDGAVQTSCGALLSHSGDGYALVKNDGAYTYKTLQGKDDEYEAADYASEDNLEAGYADDKQSQILLFNEVIHTFTYKVYTNGGVNAIDANQSIEDVYSNDWKPVLPEAARTPLLNMDQYRYYEKSLEGTVEKNDTLGLSISTLYGLYDDIVYTHYTPYNDKVSTYLVPNERNATSETIVARGINSNDAPVGLDGKRLYNIFWYDDNIMWNNEGSITSTPNQEIQETDPYEWEFEGDDPYAIKIKNVINGVGTKTIKYIHETSETETALSSTDATPFMLLSKDGYDYGVFTMTGSAITGQTPVMLTGHGHQLTTSNPTKFIPFALSTFKVIYHLMIKNIGEDVIIPYRGPEPEDELIDYRIKGGTTLRDLVSKDGSSGVEHVAGDKYQLGSTINGKTYCYDAHHVSLGDAFEVPQEFYRPNVSYDFYIEGVYENSGGSTGDAVPDMNNLYKGLKMTNMGVDERLLGKIVWVNIVYNFKGGLDTNSGSDFVGGVAENKWYTFETNDATPRLAEYSGTEYSGTLQTKSGYATHYTNDYLWTPVGDPYGFKMYNRYLYKNLGQKKVMSTSSLATTTPITMEDDSNPYVSYNPANSVYELITNSTTTSGYFLIQPVVNMHEGTKVYMNSNSSTGAMTLSASTPATEWTFGLSEDVMRPYYQAAGYVGGLNETGKAAYETAAAKQNPLERLMALQNVVYNHDNSNSEEDPTNPNYIVHYAPGYYRLHNQPGSLGITPPRYASGYTHKIEKDVNNDGNESDAIPMHFYEVEEYDTNKPTFGDLGTANTDYTETAATRGDIPLVTVARDPASIFKFTGEASSVTMSTQGLNVIGNQMGTGAGTVFNIIDIGAGVVALQNGDNYLEYSQTSDLTNKMYDLKFGNDDTESARWCMKPVQKIATAGNGEMPLTVKTNNGGDGYYYTTFYAPFDVLMTSGNDEAYVIPEDEWPATVNPGYLNPRKIGQDNTAGNGCPEAYRGSNQFIPAGTPVIIRTTNGTVTMALPNATPSDAITTALSGEYLEQMLGQNASQLVYVLGRSYTHNFEYVPETGVVTPAGLEVDRGVGFYKNANTNRESNAIKTLWTRNNKYVYANKIYYREGVSAGAPAVTRGVEFIPVIFDDDENEGELQPDGSLQQMVGDGCIYDLMGRKVATEQQVQDGSWNTILSPGIYIINGKKFSKK